MGTGTAGAEAPGTAVSIEDVGRGAKIGFGTAPRPHESGPCVRGDQVGIVGREEAEESQGGEDVAAGSSVESDLVAPQGGVHALVGGAVVGGAGEAAVA